MIEQRSLFKLRVLDIRMKGEEPSRQLQHVVDVARLIRAAIYALSQLIRWSKIFVFTVTTGRVTVIVNHRIPKELSGNAIVLLAAVHILLQHTDHLRHLSVTVMSFQFIFATFERIQECLVIEMM